MKPLLSTLLVLAVIPAALLFAAQGAAKGEQLRFWQDNKGDITIRSVGLLTDYDPKAKITKFDAKGKVAVASRLQGVAMTAQRMTGTAGPDPAKKATQRLDNLKATGGVTILKTRTEQVAGKPVSGRTDAKGDTGTYDAGADESGTATLNGNVVIVDDLGPRKVNLLGNSGTANFSTVQKGNSALKGAVMTGNVRIKVTQTDAANVASVYNARGDRLEYAKTGEGATLTLSGNVELDSPGEGGGRSEGIDRVILTLGADGELKRVQTAAGDASQRVRTVFRPKKSPVKPIARKTGQ